MISNARGPWQCTIHCGANALYVAREFQMYVLYMYSQGKLIDLVSSGGFSHCHCFLLDLSYQTLSCLWFYVVVLSDTVDRLKLWACHMTLQNKRKDKETEREGRRGV